MPITINNPRTSSEDPSYDGMTAFDSTQTRGGLFYDCMDNLFVGVETSGRFSAPAFVGMDYLDLDREPSWPLKPAPAGTTVTLIGKGL